MQSISKNIKLIRTREHPKASEKYMDVIFTYEGNEKWEGSVPIHYRRTGTFANTPEKIVKVVIAAYKAMHPSKKSQWLMEQDTFWRSRNMEVTQPFFDALKDCNWKCVTCQLPRNPNPQRRIQAIKDLGYTLATYTTRPCPTCGQSTTHHIMLRLPRVRTKLGYETWSPTLRRKILRVLGSLDAYENRRSSSYSLLPDHKFPEIRWDQEVREENLEDITEEKILQKFQLLSNRRNQQKREVCRNCFQTGKRGTPFNISFFYKGNSSWPKNIPNRGRAAEKGCIGCGWYDLVTWRNALNVTVAKIESRKA